MSDGPNDIPYSDWQTNFYDPRGNADTTSSTTPIETRQGNIPAYRDEPLQDPYIIWDSREWVKDSDVLENAAGNPVWNLAVDYSGDAQYNASRLTEKDIWKYSIVYGFKTRNWDNSYATTANPPGGFPDDVEEMGGDTCSGAFTMMVAFSHLFHRRGFYPDRDDYKYVEIDINANYDAADGGGIDLSQNVIGDNDSSTPDDANHDVFHEYYDGAGNYCQWLAETPGPGHESISGTPIEGKLVTFTADPWAGRYWVWVDDELVKFYDIWGEYEPPGFESYQFNFFDWAGPCNKADIGANPTKFKELFTYFYGHEGPPWFYRQGAAWQSCIGAAFFRGIPKKTDLQYWRDYFIPDDIEYQPMQVTQLISRSNVGTISHHTDWTVPTNAFSPINGEYPITHVILELTPATGGYGTHLFANGSEATYCMVPCSGGDVFTFELGGGGGPSRVLNTTAAGAGGWPDGGSGGISPSSGQIGGGGGGSTKIWLNGTLIIHMPGGGGGATSSTNSGVGANSSSTGFGPSMPQLHASLEGRPSASDLLLDPSRASYFGQRGTLVAAGAGGLNGGNAGSGNNGGAGAAGSGSSSHTGGGGGGGGLFGGGGGGVNPNNPVFETYGGGSGSWYIHPSIITWYKNYAGTPGAAITVVGVPATCRIYYW